jgi:hypothetical protein
MTNVVLPPVPDHRIPSYGQPAAAVSNKAKTDDLAALAEWAS